MTLGVAFLLIFLHNAGSQDLFDEVIEEFGKNSGERAADGRQECVCVPYLHCKDNITVLDNQAGLIDIRKRESPCSTVHASHSNLLVCCKQPVSTKLDPTPENRRGCGERHPHGVGFTNPRIENDDSQFGEFPWMVAILSTYNRDKNPYKCGGALIHPKVVLTAAHCVMGIGPSQITIRAGEWDPRTTLELLPYQEREADKIITHGDYKAEMLINDIALIVLKSSVEITKHIDVICIPEQGIVLDHTLCLSTGWARDIFGNENVNTAVLKKWEIPIVPHKICQESLRTISSESLRRLKFLGNNFNLHESFICGGGNDTCKVYGGNILVCPIENDPSRYHLTGILSWGLGCTNEWNNPIVYVNIPFFRDWIDDQFSKNNMSSSIYKYG